MCRCQGTGSENNDCDRETGQCECKKNYDGYQCEECAVCNDILILIHFNLIEEKILINTQVCNQCDQFSTPINNNNCNK